MGSKEDGSETPPKQSVASLHLHVLVKTSKTPARDPLPVYKHIHTHTHHAVVVILDFDSE